MTLRLVREPTRHEATMGVLFVDGHFQAFTVEDAIREIPSVPVEAWKIAGKTAIPAGRYRISLTRSQRFGRVLPLLEAVPGFTGVRIHPGNVAADTEGCILPGVERQPGGVLGSRVACDALFDHLERAAEDDRWIVIENP